jgi:small subunit ribosomal protein S16
MATKIRLRRTGATNDPSYRIVVSDMRFPRDGKFIEILGHYNPRKTGDDKVVLNAERMAYWIGTGTQVSEAVRPLLKIKGVKLPVRKTRRRTKAKAKPAPAAAAAPAQA